MHLGHFGPHEREGGGGPEQGLKSAPTIPTNSQRFLKSK